MGRRGEKLTEEATATAGKLLESLATIEGLTSKKMFGGYGVFAEDAMFALVSSEGVVHFKVAGANQMQFDDAGAKQFGRMPYWSVPESVLGDEAMLTEWARSSIAIAQEAKED